jgi:hypothetical protein
LAEDGSECELEAIYGADYAEAWVTADQWR